jgi:hypothetical protein
MVHTISQWVQIIPTGTTASLSSNVTFHPPHWRIPPINFEGFISSGQQHVSCFSLNNYQHIFHLETQQGCVPGTNSAPVGSSLDGLAPLIFLSCRPFLSSRQLRAATEDGMCELHTRSLKACYLTPVSRHTPSTEAQQGNRYSSVKTHVDNVTKY